MTDMQQRLDAPITPLPDTTIRAAFAYVRRNCPEDVADVIEEALGLK